MKGQDQSRIFPQSARTRVRRVVSQDNYGKGLVKWNEIFIFEIPEMVMCPIFFMIKVFYFMLSCLISCHILLASLFGVILYLFFLRHLFYG